MADKSLLIVQPVYTAYRAPFFEALKRYNKNTKIICARSDSSFGFKDDNHQQLYMFVDWGTASFKMMNFEIAKLIIKSDVVVHVGDFKYLSFWFAVIVRRFLRKKTYIHGQGGYKKNGIIHSVVYNFVVFISTKYICYNSFSGRVLKKKLAKFLHKKVDWVNNTLYLSSVSDVHQTCSDSIFYIGRLREGCGIELLLEAASACNVKVKVVGGGSLQYISSLKDKYDNLDYHGIVFEEHTQKDIASECFAGAYAGDAGLSVVHYFALGLPVIVHSDTFSHMGPEPDYVVDKVNGLKFERGSIPQLINCIQRLKSDSTLRASLATGALATFEKLRTPPMHVSYLQVLGLL